MSPSWVATLHLAESERMSGRTFNNGHCGLSRNSTSKSGLILLFGETAGERAKEINAAQRTLSRKADEFERVWDDKPVLIPRTTRSKQKRKKPSPPEMRQLIVDLHAELPTMSAARDSRDLLHSLRQKARPSQCQTHCNFWPCTPTLSGPPIPALANDPRPGGAQTCGGPASQ